MSCRGCQILIDCSGLDGNNLDITPSEGFFATQDYTFVIDCPPGYICFNGNVPIIIPKKDIPGVTWDGGPMCLRGCLSQICVTPLPDATQADLNSLANFLFFTWAHQQAQCNKVKNPPGPGYTPPTRVGVNRPLTISNTEQCFTANCSSGSGAPVTKCVAARTYGTTLYGTRTTDEVAILQAQMDSIALATATTQATAALFCFGAACSFGVIAGWFPTTVNPTAPNTGSLTHTHPTGSSARVVASATCSVNVGSGQQFGEDNFGAGIAFPPLAAPCLCKITTTVTSISGYAKIDFALYLNGSGTPTVVVFPAITPTLGVTVYNFTMPIATAMVEMYYHVNVGNPSTTQNGAIDVQFDFGI